MEQEQHSHGDGEAHQQEQATLISQIIEGESLISDAKPVSSFQERMMTTFFTKHFYNVLIVSISFLCVFTAFNTAQGFMTTVHKDVGNIALSTLYGVFGFSNLFMSSVESLLGPKICIFMASIPYALFVLAAGFNYNALIISSAALLGFGAALLWISHGDMMTRCAQGKYMGLYSGIFFGIFQMSGIFGFILVGVLDKLGVNFTTQFLILFTIALCGTILLFLLRSIPRNVENEPEKVVNHGEAEKEQHLSHSDVTKSTTEHTVKLSLEPTILERIKSFAKSLLDTFLVLFQLKMLLLTAFCFYSGFAAAFFMGALPPRMPKDHLPFILASYSTAEVIGSLLLGHGADLLGKRYMVWLTFVLHGVVIGMSFFVFQVNQIWLYYFTLFIAGLADSGCNTQLYAVIGNLFHFNASNAFAAYRLVQSLSSAVGFVKLDFLVYQIILGVVLSIAAVMFFVLDFCVQRVDSRKEK